MAEEQTEVKTFTQEDIDKLNQDHANALKELETRLKGETERKVDGAIKKTKAELEEKARQATMTETEKLTTELEKVRQQYQEQADINAIATQKEETRKLMSEIGVDLNCLDFVFVPKDTETTKARIEAFKKYTDEVKKNTFETNVKSTVPNTNQPSKDDFEDGFDNGLHFNN